MIQNMQEKQQKILSIKYHQQNSAFVIEQSCLV